MPFRTPGDAKSDDVFVQMAERPGFLHIPD
jgi:hypothetical protein